MAEKHPITLEIESAWKEREKRRPLTLSGRRPSAAQRASLMARRTRELEQLLLRVLIETDGGVQMPDELRDTIFEVLKFGISEAELTMLSRLHNAEERNKELRSRNKICVELLISHGIAVPEDRRDVK